MKGRIFLCLLLCPFMVKAQKLQTFEMRYFTSDVKANGETDFHGETEWMDTEQRVDFLNKYAEYASQYWGNPQLDKPLLTNEEVKDGEYKATATDQHTSYNSSVRMEGLWLSSR